MMKKVYCLLSMALIVSILSGCGGDGSASPLDHSANTNTSQAEEESEEIVIADDNYITATFEKMYDATAMGVEGVFYIDINVENKTDKEIWVYLDKASVNDETVPTVGSGVPLYIQPEKSGRNGFIISFSSLSIETIEEVKNIAFDLVVAEKETMKEIERVESIDLDF